MPRTYSLFYKKQHINNLITVDEYSGSVDTGIRIVMLHDSMLTIIKQLHFRMTSEIIQTSLSRLAVPQLT